MQYVCHAQSFFLCACLVLFFSSILILSSLTALSQTIPGDTSLKWLKADLHTHHTFGDPLEDIIKAYQDTGYNFLVLSTKDDVKVLDYESYSTPEMRIVNGVEQSFLTRKNKLGHVIAFRIKSPYPFTSAWTLKEGCEKLRKKNPDVILGINHPHDGRWSLDDALEAAEQGHSLFELNSIDMKHGEFETALWDQALSKGARLYATLTNDVHHKNDIDVYGYILIHADPGNYKSIASALKTGNFYAVESGCAARIERNEIIETASGKILEIRAPGAAEIRITGHGGALLTAYKGESASHSLSGLKGYVRAEISDISGLVIFLQPFFL